MITQFYHVVDLWFKIKPLTGISDTIREIHVESRDCEKQIIPAKFVYPIHEVNQDFVNEKRAKTQAAKDCIIYALKGVMLPEREVRFHVLGLGHTDYAFNRALKELEEEGRLVKLKMQGQAGNRKLLQLIPHP